MIYIIRKFTNRIIIIHINIVEGGGDCMRVIKKSMIGKKVCLSFDINRPDDQVLRRKLAELAKLKKVNLSRLIIQQLKKSLEEK